METALATRTPARHPVVDGVADTERYFNRELSWLSFNERVLDEATNPNHPLLERLRFLSISGNNLDEFYMVRVAGLRGQVNAGIETLIRRFTNVLFPGYEMLGDGAFRVIRDSDLELEEEAEDLVLYFKSAIKRRRRGRIIRLEPRPNMPEALDSLVKEEIGGADTVITDTQAFLGVADLAELVDEDRPDLKFPAFAPRFPERIREHGGDCFAAFRSKDIVVHHP